MMMHLSAKKIVADKITLEDQRSMKRQHRQGTEYCSFCRKDLKFSVVTMGHAYGVNLKLYLRPSAAFSDRYP